MRDGGELNSWQDAFLLLLNAASARESSWSLKAASCLIGPKAKAAAYSLSKEEIFCHSVFIGG